MFNPFNRCSILLRDGRWRSPEMSEVTLLWCISLSHRYFWTRFAERPKINEILIHLADRTEMSLRTNMQGGFPLPSKLAEMHFIHFAGLCNTLHIWLGARSYRRLLRASRSTCMFLCPCRAINMSILCYLGPLWMFITTNLSVFGV